MGYLIPPTTQAVTSQSFFVSPGEQYSVIAPGLAGAETVQIQIAAGSKDSPVWHTLTESSSLLTSSAWATSINKGGHYRCVKSATTASVGVNVN